MSVQDYVSRDLYGYVCIPYEDLDAAFLQGDKGLILPQTCFTGSEPRTPEALSIALGRPPTYDEWVNYSYLWFRTHDPDRPLFRDVPLPSPVPVPGGGLLMATMLLLWLISKLPIAKVFDANGRRIVK
jgi:hypothetical protein